MAFYALTFLGLLHSWQPQVVAAGDRVDPRQRLIGKRCVDFFFALLFGELLLQITQPIGGALIVACEQRLPGLIQAFD